VLEGRTLGGTSGVPWSLQLKALDPANVVGRRPGRNEPPDAYMSFSSILVEVKLDEP